MGKCFGAPKYQVGVTHPTNLGANKVYKPYANEQQEAC